MHGSEPLAYTYIDITLLHGIWTQNIITDRRSVYLDRVHTYINFDVCTLLRGLQIAEENLYSKMLVLTTTYKNISTLLDILGESGNFVAS